MNIWRAAVTVPGRCVDLFCRIFESEPAALATWGDALEGPWLIEATFVKHQPDEALLRTRLALAAAAAGVPAPDLVVEPVRQADWATAVLAGFPPFRVARFFIHGSHYQGPLPAATIDLCIDAATAFGTGEHGSTKGCLLALHGLTRRLASVRRRPRRILDMGCGSGILAIAAAKLFRGPVCAVDIDVDAVQMSRHNARVNGVAPLLSVGAGPGFSTSMVRRQRPFDVIVENILARPVVRMAPALARSLHRPGWVVLSGFLDRHERMVLQAHRRFGLALVGRITVSGWRTLILRRGPPSALRP